MPLTPAPLRHIARMRERFCSYSSGKTACSVKEGASNWRQTSLMPMQTEIQSGLSEMQSRSVRAKVAAVIARDARIGHAYTQLGIYGGKEVVDHADIAMSRIVTESLADGADAPRVGHRVSQKYDTVIFREDHGVLLCRKSKFKSS